MLIDSSKIKNDWVKTGERTKTLRNKFMMNLTEGATITTTFLFNLENIKAKQVDDKVFLYPHNSEKLAKFLNEKGIKCQALLDVVEIPKAVLKDNAVYSIEKEYEYSFLSSEELNFLKEMSEHFK